MERNVPDPKTESTQGIDRREALRRVGLMVGGTALVGGSAFLSACTDGERPTLRADGGYGEFSPEDIALLDEIAETILPETDTPGAKAAEVGAFMALMVTDVFAEEDQVTFRRGMRAVDQRSREATGRGFMVATPEERHELLTRLDEERFSDDVQGPHYFSMMKQLTLFGYFTSEIGCTMALQYEETPGRYDPCADYTPGERSWASHA